MTLAIFDLDNTLLEGDSDSAWFHFLVEQRAVADEYNVAKTNLKFYHDYVAGKLNFDAYADFAFGILSSIPLARLKQLRKLYFKDKILPMVRPKAVELIDSHRKRKHTLLVSTATNNFLTEPVSRYLNMDGLLATQLEQNSNGFSGKYFGTPNFREGKVDNLMLWLKNHPQHQLATTYFYSDSINDKPLLEIVGHPRVVNPDEQLRLEATKRRWHQINLRD